MGDSNTQPKPYRYSSFFEALLALKDVLGLGDVKPQLVLQNPENGWEKEVVRRGLDVYEALVSALLL